jgi:phosphoserine phosphatase
LNSRSHSLETADRNKEFAFFRVEKGLLAIRSARTAFHYARNAQAFSERANRLLGVGAMALLCPVASLGDRAFATRLLHLPLCGMSRDRLDLLGEEYFNHVLRNSLNPNGIERVQQLFKAGLQVVLVSHELDHVIRPLAGFLKVEYLVANRLEFRDDLATGRLLDPIIPPLGFLARSSARGTGGLISGDELKTQVLLPKGRGPLEQFMLPTARQVRAKRHPVVNFSRRRSPLQTLSVRKTLAGKNILLIGSTGFIGKVWLCTLLHDLPELGRIYLLIRRQGSRSALQRFEKIVAESPAFKTLHERHGETLPDFLGERVDIVEGDVSEPQLGLDDSTAARLQASLDLVVNSAGLTDFNPDLRLALSTNADSILHLVKFLKKCNHAGLIHVSTCFVNGRTDGRVPEELHPNYTPGGHPDFDAHREWQFLHENIDRVSQEAESSERTEQFRSEALRQKGDENAAVDRRFLQNFVRKARTRWIREQLIELGIRQANRWGWPNIYTYTKSLGESLLAAESGGLPGAVVRPSIVESSVSQPFRGWNEGVNTTAPLSYLLGTYFRQLPSNKRKRLDVIPVDLVCRGLTLVCAALILRCHEKVYQLATSATNPADMRRAIELTGLAHRKHYGSLQGLEHWLRARFDTIPVSKTRYRNVSLPFFQLLLQGTRRVLLSLAFKGEALARKQRALERVQKVIELYEPFILDNEYFFAADHIKALSNALPEEEVESFGYNTEVIDWYDYWINLHVPALRRWTYPLIEGRRPETGLLPRNFKLPVRSSTEHTPNDLLQHATQGGD